MKYLFIILLPFVVGCARNPVTDTVSGSVDTLSLDSLGHTPDTLHVLEGPKTLNIQGKKIKLKRGAMLVVNQGQGNTATTIGKTKNSTLAVGEKATATDNSKANGSVAVGQNASATGSTQIKEVGWPWYVWLAVGLGLLYGGLRLKKHLDF